MLKGKTILLGVSGSIAAFRAIDLTSQLTQEGASVHVILTASALQFLTPLSFKVLSRNPVTTSLRGSAHEWQPDHIALADQADALLVAPASAGVLARFALGLASDVLSTIYLATRAPVFFAPAMNGKMYLHPATQAHCDLLKSRGHTFIEPVTGLLACGYEGIGKLAANDVILSTLRQQLAN